MWIQFLFKLLFFIVEEMDEDMNDSSEENSFPVIERVAKNDRDQHEGDGSGSDIDEQELRRLLGPKDRKPMMRMYADEVEERQKADR